jgi:hypothetical protein
MMVIYTYFSASSTVVAQDEDTKMYLIFSMISVIQGTIKITYT